MDKVIFEFLKKQVAINVHILFRAPGCIAHALFSWIIMIEVWKKQALGEDPLVLSFSTSCSIFYAL